MMNEPGTKVFVRWYGYIVQAETIDRKGHCDWPAEWIPIRMEIPNSEGKPIVPGVRNICMFHMRHVYDTAEEAQLTESDFKQQSQQMPATVVTPAPKPTSKPVSEAWQAIQKFKEEHWDQERNYLRIDAIEEFYRLWRASVAARYGVNIEEPPVTVVAVDPGSPDGDHSATYIVDTGTGEILSDSPSPQAEVVPQPIVTEERYQQLKQQLKPKLTKKQLRSTGRIEYTDSIQTSFFD